MNHQGLRWNVHCVANVALRIRLNLYKRGFKIYDLLVYISNKQPDSPLVRAPCGKIRSLLQTAQDPQTSASAALQPGSLTARRTRAVSSDGRVGGGGGVLLVVQRTACGLSVSFFLR